MYVKIRMYIKSKIEKLNIETMDERETKNISQLIKQKVVIKIVINTNLL